MLRQKFFEKYFKWKKNTLFAGECFVKDVLRWLVQFLSGLFEIKNPKLIL